MVDVQAIESDLLACIREKQWQRGHNLLAPHMSGGERGWAKYWAAVLLQEESSSHVLDAVVNLREAITLLADDGRTHMMSLLRGIRLALQIDDTDWAMECAKTAIELVKGNPSLVQWKGPLFYAKAMMYQRLSELASMAEDRTQARDHLIRGIKCAEKCIAFWEVHEGPWDVSFRRCQANNARMLLGELFLANNQRAEACTVVQAVLKAAEEGAKDVPRVYCLYWSGIVHAEAGRWSDAASELFAAIALAENGPATDRFLARITLRLADVVLRVPDRRHEFETQARGLIERAAAARNVGLVDTLKRALATCRNVGRRSNEACVPEGIAGSGSRDSA